MATVEPVAWEADAVLGLDPERRRRRRWAVAGTAVVVLMIGAFAVWMLRAPTYQKFCAGGGAIGTPVRASAEEAFEAWAGDKAGDYEQHGNTWVRDKGNGRTAEAYVAQTEGGYAVDSFSDCERYPDD